MEDYLSSKVVKQIENFIYQSERRMNCFNVVVNNIFFHKFINQANINQPINNMKESKEFTNNFSINRDLYNSFVEIRFNGDYQKDIIDGKISPNRYVCIKKTIARPVEFANFEEWRKSILSELSTISKAKK